MFPKQSNGNGRDGSAAPISSDSSVSASPEAGSFMPALERRRLYRDVTFALRSGLRDAAADFSFLRLRGLRNLLKSLRSVAGSDDAIRLFRHSQSVPELQVVPVLLKKSLRPLQDDPTVKLDNIFAVDPLKISSPATDSEVVLALRVLEGCCLLHKDSATLVHQHKAIKVLMNILSTGGMLERGACLDALISLTLDSPENQMDFKECQGINKVAGLIKDELGNENLRLKCGEFLLLLTGHVSGRREAPLATMHEDIRHLLGEKCASLVWAASQFGSTLDPDQRQTALRVLARWVMESVELY